MGTVVIYFSMVGETFFSGKIKKITIGHTEVIAKKISKKLRIPSYSLKPIIPYPDSYNELLQLAKNEKENRLVVPYERLPVDWQGVDTIFLGFPNWLGSLPRIVVTFLNEHDFSDKTIYPFCTHEGNAFGESLHELKISCSKAKIKQGLAICGTKLEKAGVAINHWLAIYKINRIRRNKTMAKNEEVKKGIIFPIGEKNELYAQYFIGQSYLASLVGDENINVGVANVTFEPECRNNWHIHHDGFQLLLVTGGEGWYQEEGKSAQFLKAGDVVTIHGGVKHWHGASKDSWFEHLAITSGTAKWLESVTDEWYENLQ